MPLYHYKTVDASGLASEGKMDAKDKTALYHNIRKDGVTVISAEEVKKSSFSFTIPFIGGVSTHNKITFARNLGSMINAGLPITRSLSIMERQSKGELKRVLGSLSDTLSKGQTLSDGMGLFPRVFSALFVSMVKAGEESGNLSLALKNVSEQMEKTYQLTRKIRGALMYPAVILGLMVVIGALMMVYMVPTLTATFVGLNVDLPVSTKVIIAISNFLKNYFLFAFVGVVVAAFGAVLAFRTSAGQRLFDTVLLKMPIIGEMVKQVNSARTARTLSSLLSSGVDIIVAISVTKEVIQNSYYKDVLEEIQIAIQKGDQISHIFILHEKLYPLFVGEMVSVGEETGKIGEMLVSVASFYEDEVDQKTKDMSSIVEPFLMIFIGLAVGLFAFSMLAPIYSLGDSIN